MRHYHAKIGIEIATYTHRNNKKIQHYEKIFTISNYYGGCAIGFCGMFTAEAVEQRAEAGA